MKTLNTTKIEELATANTGKLAASVLSNLRANFFAAKIEAVTMPTGLATITKTDGSIVEFQPIMAFLKLASLASSGLDSFPENAKYGIISKGCTPIADYATEVQTTTVTAAKPTASAATPESQLKSDIENAFNAKINALKDSLKTALSSTDLMDSYMLAVTANTPLAIDSVDIDTSTTMAIIQAAKFAETIEQITSCFTGTKTEVEITIASDGKTAECTLFSWDKANETIVLEKLGTFGFKTRTFDKKNAVILAKLNSQVLTITL
jgi:hypothetical protein